MDISLNIRKRSFSGQYGVHKCVICQENKTDTLEHKKQRGIQTLKERASQRQKIRDIRYYEAIDRQEKLHTSDAIENVIQSSLIRNKSKPLKPEQKGKRQMLNRQSRNMALHVRIGWLRRRPNTRVENL